MDRRDGSALAEGVTSTSPRFPPRLDLRDLFPLHWLERAIFDAIRQPAYAQTI
jgi:hypothetical protein